MNYTDYVPILKALADETRLKIVEMLSKEDLCACKILEHFSITQPTLSYHMRILCDSEIVNGIRNGAWMNYSLNKEVLEAISKLFDDFMINKNQGTKCGGNCKGDR
jgi:ArsR family transcriptional regulator